MKFRFQIARWRGYRIYFEFANGRVRFKAEPVESPNPPKHPPTVEC